MDDNALHYGDNLSVLRESIADESVDLIYLDPPFNSNATYNVLFKAPTGEESQAQIEAFGDTWHWNEAAEDAYDQVMRSPNSDAANMLRAMRSFLHENDMMAYLCMMAVRLLELHRVLKPTGALYLHCDPTASHYLKALLDAVFGPKNFRTEISWRRQSAHSDAKQGRKQYGNIRDIIFFYTKSDTWTWNWVYTPYSRKYIEDFYKYVEADTGRRYRLSDLSGPGGAAKGNPRYELMGVTRCWRFSKDKMEKLIAEGRVVQTKAGAVPAQKRYLDEMPGVALQNNWDDIKPASGKEFLGYPTQKPLALLERIISASSNVGDVVLDPFCGCGTAVHAAQKLNRKWIGIDITHLAIDLIENRLRKAFPGIAFRVHGVPQDLGGARNLAARDKYEFQKWIVAKAGGKPFRSGKKGMDRGIDGYLRFQDANRVWQHGVISVKGGDNVGPTMIRDLKGTMERDNAALGLFLTLTPPSREMIKEAASAGFYETGGQRVPRLQILTAEDLFEGKKAQTPFGFVEGYKQAVREDQSEIKQGKLI